MNKSDIILMLIVITITLLLFIFLKQDKSNVANVYYENNIIKTIDLNKDEFYKVEGYNGEVLIEVKNNKIRVIKETSPYNLCSKQGFVDSVPIICLPNKIIIKIEKTDIDAVVR